MRRVDRSDHLAYGGMVLASLLVMLSAVPSYGQSLADIQRRLEAGEPTRIVCFGDSITGAYYHTGGQRAWCEMLGIALEKLYPSARLTMINAGISGHTTENALARIDQDVIAREPHLVVVMFGMNDVTRIPEDVYRSNLETILQKCGAAQAAVVLCTPNSVYENPGRPNEKLARYASIVEEVAAARDVPLVDVFARWQKLREQDERGWKLLMSDDIHPNMNGHLEFARVIAEQISGRSFVWRSVPPPPRALPHAMARLREGKRLKLVTFAPYDRLIPQILRRHFPDADFEVVVCPSDRRTITEIRAWSEGIRGLQPDLVVISLPADVQAADETEFIQNFEWVLNYSLPFEGRAWDVLPILPNVHAAEAAADFPYAAALREIVVGKDLMFLERKADDDHTAEQILHPFFEAVSVAGPRED